MTNELDAVKALSGPIFLMVWAMLVLLLDLGSEASGRRRSILPGITILGFVLAAVAGLENISSHGMAMPYLLDFGGRATSKAPVTFFGGGMVADGFGAEFTVIVCIVGSLVALMSGKYLAEKGINQGEFYALLLLASAGACLMALSFDLVNVFVSLEVLSVALYILSGFARRERRSEEAAVKYFLLGAFASGFLLFGTSLVYGAVGMAVQNQPWASNFADSSYTNFFVIGEALRNTHALGTPLLGSPIFVAGIGLVIVGIAFKAAIVPFHSYAPDVYEGAPTPVTAFMSVVAKVGAFGVLIRLVYVLTAAGVAGPFHDVLWGLAAATMLVGNILAVRQTNVKRMLAYSSIAHAGYILVGVVATMTADVTIRNEAWSAIGYYLFAYSFMNVGAFALVIWLGKGGEEILSIRQLNGLGKRSPLAAAAMSIVMLSLAGIPPTAGFVGKLYLFLTALAAGERVLAVFGLLVSAIGVFYYLNLIVAMYFRPSESESSEAPLAGSARVAALIAVAAILLFGLVPGAAGIFTPAAALPEDTGTLAAMNSPRTGVAALPGSRSSYRQSAR